MTKSIIFIPRSHFLESDRIMPHLGPLYLKSFLESKGHSVDIEDTPETFDFSSLEEYEIVGISATTPQYYESDGGKDLATKLKEIFPQKKLIIGGSHASNYYTELIKEGVFTHIIRGDGELALLDILNGKELPQIISYPQLSEEEMNDFPTPFRSLKHLSKYNYTLFDKPATTVLTTRYCAMKCKFCEERDTKLRIYHPEKIDEELNQIKGMGFEALMFYDDILPLNEERTKSLTEVINKYNFLFRCNGHARIISKNKGILNYLIRSGCREICLGIESGDQEILDQIGKGNLVSEIFDSTEAILERGVNVSAYLMIGLPGESRRSIDNTRKYIERFSGNKQFGFDLTIFYPYRFTYIREHLNEFDLQLDFGREQIGAYKKAGGESECCISTSHLTREDIINERQKILRDYEQSFRGKITPKVHESKKI
jgi:anaerobic magnesium-protoporphyrin IX monomethyl ester cyclase